MGHHCCFPVNFVKFSEKVFSEYLQANTSILCTGNKDPFETVRKHLLSVAMVSRAWTRHYPTKEEISCSTSNNNWDAQPGIKRHEHKHKEISDKHLNHVKDGLYKMTPC